MIEGIDPKLFAENLDYFLHVIELESAFARLNLAFAIGDSVLVAEISPQATAALDAVKKLERQLRANQRTYRRQIARKIALKEFVEKTTDQLLLANSRISILSRELEAAERRGDKDRAMALIGDLKLAAGQRNILQKTLERLHERIVPSTKESVN